MASCSRIPDYISDGSINHIDRENVGGSESSQQSSFVVRGVAIYNNHVWSKDGLVITDPASIGASPGYYDFDAFEEM